MESILTSQTVVALKSRLGYVRTLPDFLIIGAEKCGTTSLYEYVVRHPYVAPAKIKEPHYFDWNWTRGIVWYRSRFPSLAHRVARQVRGAAFMTGEASPDYIFHPHAPRRAHATLPGAKLIALLRNPIDRAYSHYQQQVRKGRETLPFADALEAEAERTAEDCRRVLAEETTDGLKLRRFSYLARGLYAEQLERWLDFYGRRQLLVLRTEDLLTHPAAVVREVIEFLDLPRIDPVRFVPEFARHNEGNYTTPMDPALRQKLVDKFAPHNRRLQALVGRDFTWDS